MYTLVHNTKKKILHPLGQASALFVSVFIFYFTRKTWIEKVWEVFPQFHHATPHYSILLLPTCIFYVPYVGHWDFAGIFCLLLYFFNRWNHSSWWQRYIWIIAMLILYFDNIRFSIINALEPKISNKYIDYNLFYYITFYTKTLWPGLKNIKLYYPICVCILTFMVVIIHFTKSYIKKNFSKTIFYRMCLAISHSFNRFIFSLKQYKLLLKNAVISYWNNPVLQSTINNVIKALLHPLVQIASLGISILIFYLTRKAWLESAWETFGPIDISAKFNVLLLPPSIFYVPFMNRLDLVGVFCLFYYYINRRFNPGRWNKTPWTIAMWALYFDNLVFNVHKSLFLYSFEIPFKKFDYNFLEYKSYFIEPTRLPFLNSFFYFPRVVGFTILTLLLISFGKSCVRKYYRWNP
jgi:hypothetical protein